MKTINIKETVENQSYFSYLCFDSLVGKCREPPDWYVLLKYRGNVIDMVRQECIKILF